MVLSVFDSKIGRTFQTFAKICQKEKEEEKGERGKASNFLFEQ